MSLRLALVVLMVVGCSGLVQAAMYKYVDDKGRVHYSQSPPPNGQAQEIKPPPPPPSRPAAAEPNPAAGAGQTATDPAASGTKPDDAEAARRKAESAKIKAENCARAKRSLEMFNNPQNRLLKRPDGTYERVTPESRQQNIQAARRNIAEFCN
ncbi:MAG: DUF4124 domain-containing protein [Gammaproteobacteria bacterium]|nr:DUF4124 domain-containing protein [Gammaproteobacteria bacterium]